LPALLKNKYFLEGKSLSYVLIPENKNFVKGKSASIAPSSLKGSHIYKINTCKSKILVLSTVLSEFLKNRHFGKEVKQVKRNL
jgi:hypothetical protein